MSCMLYVFRSLVISLFLCVMHFVISLFRFFLRYVVISFVIYGGLSLCIYLMSFVRYLLWSFVIYFCRSGFRSYFLYVGIAFSRSLFAGSLLCR